MRKFILLPFLIFALQSNAQEKIDTDRPDQTESSALVPKGWFQAELGFQKEKESGLETYLHPSALWKFGLIDWFELRLITELSTITSNMLGVEFSKSGLLPVQLGFKIKLFEEKGWRPQAGFIFHNSFARLSSEKFKHEEWAPNFRFVLSNTISKNISIGYNLGAEWDGISTSPRWLYTFAPSIEAGDKWKFYVESYGFAGKSIKPEHSIAGGVIYFVSRDVQLDVSPSFGLTEAATDNYITVGLSFRFK